MKKYLKISFLVFILVSISISGCIGRSIEIIGDTDRVELLTYDIEAYDKNKNKISDELTSDSRVDHYKITGEVKNIGDLPLDKIWVSIKFLDRDNNFLDSSFYLITYLAINEIANFTITYLLSDEISKELRNMHFVLIALNHQDET